MAARAHKATQQGSLNGDLPQGPRTVQAAKLVNLALVSYTDENGRRNTQLAIVGDNTVHLLEGKMTGFATVTTPQGRASDWLRDGIVEVLQANG